MNKYLQSCRKIVYSFRNGIQNTGGHYLVWWPGGAVHCGPPTVSGQSKAWEHILGWSRTLRCLHTAQPPRALLIMAQHCKYSCKLTLRRLFREVEVKLEHWHKHLRAALRILSRVHIYRVHKSPHKFMLTSYMKYFAKFLAILLHSTSFFNF